MAFRPSLLILSFCALATACGTGSPGTPPRDARPPLRPVEVVDPGAQMRLPAGTGAAGIGFGRVVADQEVVALVERYGVRPYEVWLIVGQNPAVHEVTVERASADAIAEARRVKAEQVRSAPCVLVARAGALQGRGTPPAPGERDPGSRYMLSEIEAVRAASGTLRSGAPAVYGLKVVGGDEALRRLAADPLVRQLNPGIADGAGGWMVPGPAAPGDADGRGRGPRVLPSVDAMSTEEVRRRLAHYASDGLPECAEAWRNMEMTERTTKIANGAVVEGVAFTARSVADSARENAVGPTRVRTLITVQNRAGRPVDLAVRGCTEGVRAYRDPARSVPALPHAHRGAQCMQDPFAIPLRAGESREFESGIDADRLLGDSLPPGRYYLSATFRLRDRTIEIPAGDVVLSTGLDALRYRASTGVAGSTLHGRGVVINAGASPISVEYGSCALRLRAYRTAARTGPPAWRSEGRQPYGGGGFYACDLAGRGAVIAPGDSLARFGVESPVIEVLGDSLPDGRYYFTAVIELNSGASPEIPAGETQLSARRRAMGPERISGVMTFRANPEFSNGGVQVAVTGRLSHADGALEQMSAECPVVLHAYRTREERDRAPRAGPPAWTSHSRCGREMQEYSLSRGESRTWRVQASSPQILDAGLPPGRYYFAVVVNHEGTRTFLLAGDAQLAR
jgi:hypothetical protein